MDKPLSISTDRAGEQLMIRGAGDYVDLRIFSVGTGPAQVPMPTKQGFTLPAAMLPALIAGLQTLETAARSTGAIGGDA